MRNFRIQSVLTTSLLTGTGVYTSDPINVEQYNQLRGKALSDQSGSLALQAGDTSEGPWDTVATVAVTGGTVATFDQSCITNWMRLVYTNGATDQTSFRLSAYKDPFS